MGKIIALEGCDGCGKDTQLNLLYDRLVELGYNCLKISFPVYYNKTGKHISKYLSAKNTENFNTLDYKSRSLWYSVNRYEAFKDIDIDKYDFILMGRSVLSNIACHVDGSGHKFDMDKVSEILELEYQILKNPSPDLIIVYDIGLELALKNLSKTKNEYIYSDDTDINETNSALLSNEIIVYRKLCSILSYTHIIDAYNIKDYSYIMRDTKSINNDTVSYIKKYFDLEKGDE